MKLIGGPWGDGGTSALPKFYWLHFEGHVPPNFGQGS